ncbi:M15 family metallopeptidase [Romboutsia maritimum]|nr:M15 family metallopeptidase [Romboutsia maritimum]
MRVLVIALSVAVVLVSSFNIVNSFNKEEKQNTNILNYHEDNTKNGEKTHDVGEYIEGKKPLYVDGIVVVNKDYCLPKDYKSDKEKEALAAIDKMTKDAKHEDVNLNIRSGYRSYKTQENLFNLYANRDGKEDASTYSAKPGQSEHQTGLAYDFTDASLKSVGNWFDDTKEAKWLYENAYKYGFILRYPPGKTNITGYIYESWHYRYVGTEHSNNFIMNCLTLEEYLGIN